MFVVQEFSEEAAALYSILQGIKKLLCEQEQRFYGLVDTYCWMSGTQGPLSEDIIEKIVSVQPAEVKLSFLITQ